MREFSVTALAQIIRAPVDSSVNAGPAAPFHSSFFTGVSTDSRTTKPGDCFFAIVGDNFDGHDFLAEAFSKGAACAVVRRDTKTGKFADRTVLKVDDTIKALGDLAREYRRRGNFKVVAITGSVGKTTTRQIVHHVLSQHYQVYQAPNNYNNNIGLPLTLLGAGPNHKIIVAELGSNCPGEIAYLTRIAQPDVAMVTNVHPVHLAGFGDLQALTQEKLSISEGLRPGGDLIVNGDCDLLVKTCRAKGEKVITFGKSDRGHIQVRNITYSDFNSSFTIEGTQVCLPLPGPGNVENALAAWAVCSRLGLTIHNFGRALKTVSAVPMRAEFLHIGTLTVLNDCYNANPASMKNALDILVRIGFAQKRRLVFICGDMAELGRQTRRLHAELGVWVAKAKIQLLVAVGKFACVTAAAAKRRAEHKVQIKSFEDTASACNNLEKFIEEYDIILVKGSRVAKLEMVIERLKALFSSGVARTSNLDPPDRSHKARGKR